MHINIITFCARHDIEGLESARFTASTRRGEHTSPFQGSTYSFGCSKLHNLPSQVPVSELQATCRFQARWLSSFLSLGAASLGLKRAQRAPTPLVFHWFLYPSIPTFLSTHCVPGSTQGAEEEVEDLGLSSQAQGHNGLQAKWNLGQTMNGDRLSLWCSHPLSLGVW